mmetsp:Transcript_40331/g.93513  ORF Transcript_40331/g.93513 Transcript_40331/m.93513 type:complete len:200 (-) Transcript_40331:602-1201(-)
MASARLAASCASPHAAQGELDSSPHQALPVLSRMAGHLATPLLARGPASSPVQTPGPCIWPGFPGALPLAPHAAPVPGRLDLSMACHRVECEPLSSIFGGFARELTKPAPADPCWLQPMLWSASPSPAHQLLTLRVSPRTSRSSRDEAFASLFPTAAPNTLLPCAQTPLSPLTLQVLSACFRNLNAAQSVRTIAYRAPP